VSAAIERQRWDMLRARRAAVAARLFRRDALRSIGWYLGSTVGRRLRPISRMLAGEGFTVALIAPDGAGKTTLTRALVRSLPYRTRRVYMGYGAGGGTSGAVGGWLLRLAGSHPSSGSGPKRPARAAGRFAARLGLQVGRSLIVSAHRLFGRAVLLDRHASEAWLGLEAGGSRAALYQRLLQSVSPRVDLVVLLDTEPDVLHRRKPEHPLERLARQRQAYRRLIGRIPGAVVVDATGSAEDVRKALTNVIWQRCIARGNTRAE
jgi:thymidylate kinase